MNLEEETVWQVRLKMPLFRELLAYLFFVLKEV